MRGSVFNPLIGPRQLFLQTIILKAFQMCCEARVPTDWSQMVDLLLMDETLVENPALNFTFLEKAVSAWLSAQETKNVGATKATPKQILIVFKLIKAEYNDRIARVAGMNSDHEMVDEEELKTEEMMSEVPLLKKLSSGMRVEPYSRLAALTSTVNILENLIKLLAGNEQIPEHELLRIESSPDQFKVAIK